MLICTDNIYQPDIRDIETRRNISIMLICTDNFNNPDIRDIETRRNISIMLICTDNINNPHLVVIVFRNRQQNKAGEYII